ncbi:NB-ARC and TPR domain protein [Cadophora sp. DSE1049]|nr:NB-ARC and TPR domain protein [Cadophora sp. DSE1049]
MEISQMEQLLSDQWTSAASAGRDQLERDDLRQILDFGTWEDVQVQIQSSRGDPSIHQEFAILVHGLLKLRTFTDNWIRQASSRIDTSVLWGLLRVFLKVPPFFKLLGCAASNVIRMLRENCHKIDILNNQFTEANTFTAELKECCVEIGVTFLSFLFSVVKFMRNDIIYTTHGTSLEIEWAFLEQQFSSTSRHIDEVLSRIEMLSKFAERSSQASRTSSVQAQPLLSPSLKQLSLSVKQAKLPCVVLPAIRTSRYFDRVNVGQKIEVHFNKVGTEQSFRSLAIHGLGGVGKSIVALRYAENKLRKGELDALFWVHSEKLVSIKQSFTDIALRLKLPDARQGDHDENLALVLNWLQQTHCRWLIVYDNAEFADLIRDFWPLASRGQALITTRNPSLAFELADRMMEHTSWDNQTGLSFLLHLLSTDITSDLKEDVLTSAQQLSQKLSGHALAISAMAGLIHSRALSIAEFMNFYDQAPSHLHGISGNRSINALWSISFKSLNPQSHTILGVMAFVEPDSIPQALFEFESPDDVPESLRFCSDRLSFSSAIETLLTLALVKRDRTSRTFSLHRLVQAAFKHSMTSEQRQEAFNNAAILTYHTYPQKDANRANLYLMWDLCAKYLLHVISLKDCFREEKKLNPKFTALSLYCSLNNSCQRYLLEINSLDDLADLIEVNTMALNTLPPEDQAISLQGSLTPHRGQLLLRLGKPEEGVQLLEKSYEIRSHNVPFSPRESAWAANNVATGMATLNDFTEALEWYERSRGHYLEWSNQQENKGELSPTIMIEMGLCLVYSALRQIEYTNPYNWARAAGAHFGLGLVDRHNIDFESAETHFLEAQNLWLKGDQMRTNPFNAGCMYRLGCVAMDRGKVESAVRYLRDALTITQMRPHITMAEHARVLFKLSEALEQEPRHREEAQLMREEAERLLRLRSPNAVNPGSECTYDSLILIEWR